MNEFLTKMNKRLENASTIKFMYEPAPISPKKCVELALSMKPTVTCKSNRKQYLGSSRSMQDLYLICKHYFPEITLLDVSNILKSLYNDGKINTLFCTTFNKRMFKSIQYSTIYRCPTERKRLKKYFNE